MEFALYIIYSIVRLDNLDTRKRLVNNGYQVAHTLLHTVGRVTQTLDNRADNNTHNRQEECCKECHLPRHLNHQHQIADNEERLTESDLQRICNAELHGHNIGGDFRDNIAFALFAEIAHIHIDDVVEHRTTHTQQRCRTHLLDRIGTEIAERIAQHVAQYHRH